nr:DUF1835 domain-containing protein [uncultured Rhodopila sp.]
MDADIPTLHIRCGSDIRDTLRAAGFTGEYLEYADTICQGPVPDTDDLLQHRARFLAGAAGGPMGFTAAQALVRPRDEDQRLDAARSRDRVVLWFEHDSHDQLILARILARFAGGPLPGRLELICADGHPSVERFLGLGQLGPEALASLWPARTAVTRAQLDLGRAVWAALRRDDPRQLQAIAATGTPDLPLAAPALRRHLRELPADGDGLSLTQRLILSILAEGGPSTIGRLFAPLQRRDPLPFLGDLGFLHIVEQMAPTGVLTIAAGEKPFPRIASITDTGRDVLAGRTDFLSLRPAERWIGGVRIDPLRPAWRIASAADPRGENSLHLRETTGR